MTATFRGYPLRQERFVHLGLELLVRMPAAPDELIDTAEFEGDERLPYWAELWPSARALAREMLERPAPTGRVVELGCGLAIPSLALRWRGVDVLSTDYYADALDFARWNAALNGIEPPRTELLDWRAPRPGLGTFDLILAADVLYEERNAESLARLIPRIAAPGARLVLADPGRAYRWLFEQRMTEQGWTIESQRLRDETAMASGREVPSRVTIMDVVRATRSEPERDAQEPGRA